MATRDRSVPIPTTRSRTRQRSPLLEFRARRRGGGNSATRRCFSRGTKCREGWQDMRLEFGARCRRPLGQSARKAPRHATGEQPRSSPSETRRQSLQSNWSQGAEKSATAAKPVKKRGARAPRRNPFGARSQAPSAGSSRATGLRHSGASRGTSREGVASANAGAVADGRTCWIELPSAASRLHERKDRPRTRTRRRSATRRRACGELAACGGDSRRGHGQTFSMAKLALRTPAKAKPGKLRTASASGADYVSR